MGNVKGMKKNIKEERKKLRRKIKGCREGKGVEEGDKRRSGDGKDK